MIDKTKANLFALNLTVLTFLAVCVIHANVNKIITNGFTLLLMFPIIILLIINLFRWIFIDE